MSTVVVTGGAGYIGAHTCKALAAAGMLPVSFDNLSRGHAHNVRWGPLEEGDVRDGARLREVLERHHPGAVVHFAALAYVGESVDEPLEYYDHNFAGTCTLLEAMVDTGVRRLVFSSSCAVYGDPVRVPIDEAHPRVPASPYGRSKLACEQMIEDLTATGGLDAMALRYFNAAGADPGGALKEEHDPETHLIPRVLDVARGAIPQLTVNGVDYDSPDGTCVRDYIHVSDLAEAHLRALSHLEKRAGFMACNLGTGHGASVREVVETVERVSGRRVPWQAGPRRAGDPAVAVASPELAHRKLGWVPQYSDLSTIVETAWRSL